MEVSFQNMTTKKITVKNVNDNDIQIFLTNLGFPNTNPTEIDKLHIMYDCTSGFKLGVYMKNDNQPTETSGSIKHPLYSKIENFINTHNNENCVAKPEEGIIASATTSRRTA